MRIFHIKLDKDVLWRDIQLSEPPQYLLQNIDRILSTTSHNRQNTEAFSRMIIDQILTSVIYDENKQVREIGSSISPEDPTVFWLRYNNVFEESIVYEGEKRLLSGSPDFTVCYWPKRSNEPGLNSNYQTNLIIVKAKEAGYVDICKGQLAAYMGMVQSCHRKSSGREDNSVHGVASDGLSFRFCRIDEDDRWSTSRLLEWELGDQSAIYSIFRTLIRIAANPFSSSPLNDSEQREIIRVFESSDSTREFAQFADTDED